MYLCTKWRRRLKHSFICTEGSLLTKLDSRLDQTQQAWFQIGKKHSVSLESKASDVMQSVFSNVTTCSLVGKYPIVMQQLQETSQIDYVENSSLLHADEL
jgi:hypothetical protein